MRKGQPRILCPLALAILCLLVAGQAVAQPVINVDPPNVELQMGLQQEFQLRISNEGDDDLVWWSHIEVVNVPDWEAEGWISGHPENGDIAPGGHEEVVVNLDLRGLWGGDYEAELHFESNDPNNNDLAVDIIAHVEGIPQLEVTWAEEVGFPDMVDFNALFRVIDVNSLYQIPITVYNPGTADLEVDNFGCDNERFSVAPSQFVLAPGRRMEILLEFFAEQTGVYEGTIVITSDRPEGNIAFSVRAEVQRRAPLIEVNWAEAAGFPNQVDFNMIFGSVFTDTAYRVPISIKDIGALELAVDSITYNPGVSGEWSVTPTRFHLAPLDEREVTICFESPVAGAFEDSIIIWSNDEPTHGRLAIPVHSDAVLAVPASGRPPGSFGILSAYPNPFNSTTTIRYQLPVGGWAEVDIVDEGGRLVNELARGRVGPGRHSVFWNAMGVPAGTYFCRLQSAGNTEVQKLLLVR